MKGSIFGISAKSPQGVMGKGQPSFAAYFPVYKNISSMCCSFALTRSISWDVMAEYPLKEKKKDV